MERNRKMAGKKGREKKRKKKNQNENTRRENNGIRVHEHACSALISRRYYRAPLSEGKTTGREGGKGWMTDAGKNRETGKGGADRPLFFVECETVAGLITEGTDCRGGGGSIVFLETSVDLEIARETSRFLIPFPKGDGCGIRGKWENGEV